MSENKIYLPKNRIPATGLPKNVRQRRLTSSPQLSSLILPLNFTLPPPQTLRSGRDGESAETRLELSTAALLMRRWPNQGRQRSLNPFPLHADPHQRIFHGGSPHIQPAGAPVRRRLGFTLHGNRFVKAASERTGVVRRRAHARLLLTGGRLLRSFRHGNRPALRTGPVQGETERGGGGVAVVHAGGGGGAAQ